MKIEELKKRIVSVKDDLERLEKLLNDEEWGLATWHMMVSVAILHLKEKVADIDSV